MAISRFASSATPLLDSLLEQTMRLCFHFTFATLLLTFSPYQAIVAAAGVYLGPSPYLAFDHPDAGTAVSPFLDIDFAYFHLEDLEDGAFNTPGVSVREFTTTNVATAFSDSVDGDDGVIDGFATGSTRSLFSNFSTSSFTFDFSASALGGVLPTHAGIVWTDVGRNFGGAPLPADLLDNTFFEAFGPTGESLGLTGPFSLGDSSISRTTGEDRFFGAIHPAGISAIRISMPGKNNWEIDHLQYGAISVPEPSGILLAACGLTCLLVRHLCRKVRSVR